LRPEFEKLAKPRHFDLGRPKLGAYADADTEHLWQFYCDGYAYAAPELARLRAVLTKIDAIRNMIVATQNVNWSRDIYPLVAALNDAGFEGKSYDEAREWAQMEFEKANGHKVTLITNFRLRAEKAEAKCDGLRDALEKMVKFYKPPSHDRRLELQGADDNCAICKAQTALAALPDSPKGEAR
jgi:hypothetical protein